MNQKASIPALQEVATCITETDLTELNDALKSVNRRKVDLTDLTRVAYVHVKSIVEHKDGASPYNRIAKFCKANGFEYDNYHLKIITDILLNIEFIKLKNGETKKGQCRTYAYCPEVAELLSSTPK